MTDSVNAIIEKIYTAEGCPEFSMTDGLIANFSRPDYVRGMSQALYKLGLITFEERETLRSEAYSYEARAEAETGA